MSDVDDRYFVSEDEIFLVPLVNEKLIGTENFFTWKRWMEKALSVRSKLGFVTGEYKKPDDPVMFSKWERCNALVMCWLMNSVLEDLATLVVYSSDAAAAWKTLSGIYGGSGKLSRLILKREIWSMRQGELDVASYFHELSKRWTELDSIRHCNVSSATENCEGCKAVVKEDKEDREMQFLMGLNDSHTEIRTSLLVRQVRERPNIYELYDMVLLDEERRSTARNSYSEISDRVANLRVTAASSVGQGSGSRAKNRKKLYCTYCKKNGHTREYCYEIIGYPEGHKFYKGNGF